MKISVNDLRKIIREEARAALVEDLKNVGGKHEKTVAGSTALRKMHDAPGVLDALAQINSATELAHVIEALIDAVPVVRRGDVLKALSIVGRHEKSTHKR